jgi:hypothetical protein
MRRRTKMDGVRLRADNKTSSRGFYAFLMPCNLDLRFISGKWREWNPNDD